MEEELKTDVELEQPEQEVSDSNDSNNQDNVEQPSEGTPDTDTETEKAEEPEFVLDEDGNLKWNDAEPEEEEDSDTRGDVQPSGEEQPAETDDKQKEFDDDVYTVKVDGKEVQVTKEELLRGYMRQADYTRKTQTLAEQKKQIEQSYRPQVQPVNQPRTQEQVPQGQNLNAIAKQIAAKNLGLESPDDLSELDFDHIAAVQDAREELKAQRNALANRQNAIQNLENQLRLEDPAYDTIMANAPEKMGNLPHKEFEKLRQAYEVGNPEPLRAFYQGLQKDYYANAIKKTSVHKKPVPKVESSNTATSTKQTKRVDFRQLGKMTTEEKAKFLIEQGIV